MMAAMVRLQDRLRVISPDAFERSSLSTRQFEYAAGTVALLEGRAKEF